MPTRKLGRPRLILRSILIVLLVLVVLAGYLSYFGFPAPFMSYLGRKADERGYYLRLDAVTLDLGGGGLVMHNVALYRKGSIGLPMVQARRADIGLDLSRDGGLLGLRTVTVTKGVVRPGNWEGLFATSDSAQDTTGRIDVCFLDCDLLGLNVANLSCVVDVKTNVTVLADISAAIPRDEQDLGVLSGELSIARGEREYYEGSFVSLADPAKFLPTIRWAGLHGLAHIFELFELGDCPQIELAFQVEEGSVLLDGTFKGTEFRFQDVMLQSGDFTFNAAINDDGQRVFVRDLNLVRPEGVVDGRLTVDLVGETVEFEGVSTIRPIMLARLVSNEGPAYIADYEFGGPVRIAAVGIVGYEDPDICEIDADVRAEQFGYEWFAAELAEFQLLRSGSATIITNMTAAAYGGELAGWLHFYSHQETTNLLYRADLAASDMELKRLVMIAAPEAEESEGYTGKFSGEIVLAGVGGAGNEQYTEGSGAFRIREGNILNIPLFGPLSGMLVKIVPGLDYVLRLTDADGEFVVDGTVVRSDEVRIEGDVLSLKADGNYDWVESTMDFDVELRFLKKKTVGARILGTILWPVTQMFRVRLRGTPDDPDWSSVNF